MKHKFASVLAVGAAALVMASSAPASAQETEDPETRAGFCLLRFYQYKNNKGADSCVVPTQDANLANNKYYKSSKGMDNSISSLHTILGKKCTVTLYQYKNYKGASSTWRGTGKLKIDRSLANNKVGDNRTSSFKVKCAK